MLRLLLALFVSTILASAAERSSVLGKVQAEIRLTDGTVFKQARIVDYSIDKSTATIAEPTRIRTVALDTLPPKLRDQILIEAGVKSADPRTAPKGTRPRPIAPTQSPVNPTSADIPVASTTAPVSHAQLMKLATTNAPDQLKAHLLRTYGNVGSLSTKVSETTEVPGWPKIRVAGETSFSELTPGNRSSSLHREKFEIEYVIADGGGLKASTVTVGGIARPVDDK